MLLVIVPVVMNTIKNNDKRKYQDFEKAITNAAEAYVESNREAYPTIDSEGKAVVRLSYIINEGYLKSNIKDPSTKKSVSPNTYVTVLKQDDNTLEYIYGGKDCELSDNGGSLTEYVGTAQPEDVTEGKTFYGNSEQLQVGSLKEKEIKVVNLGTVTAAYSYTTTTATIDAKRVPNYENLKLYESLFPVVTAGRMTVGYSGTNGAGNTYVNHVYDKNTGIYTLTLTHDNLGHSGLTVTVYAIYQE